MRELSSLVATPRRVVTDIAPSPPMAPAPPRGPIALPAPTVHPPLSLLGIPVEVRLQIYEDVFIGCMSPNELNLLHTCRQIYHEAHQTAKECKPLVVTKRSRRHGPVGDDVPKQRLSAEAKAISKCKAMSARHITRQRVLIVHWTTDVAALFKELPFVPRIITVRKREGVKLNQYASDHQISIIERLGLIFEIKDLITQRRTITWRIAATAKRGLTAGTHEWCVTHFQKKYPIRGSYELSRMARDEEDPLGRFCIRFFAGDGKQGLQVVIRGYEIQHEGP